MSDPVVSIKWKLRPGKRNSWATGGLEQMLQGGTLAFNSDIYQGIGNVLDETSGEITEWMKTNAPWEDQTGRARASLSAHRESPRYFLDGQDYGGDLKSNTITLGYSNTPDPVPYAWYLETKNAGRYQIILPAMTQWGGEVLNRIRAKLGLR